MILNAALVAFRVEADEMNDDLQTTARIKNQKPKTNGKWQMTNAIETQVSQSFPSTDRIIGRMSVEKNTGKLETEGDTRSMSQVLGLTIPNYSDPELDEMVFVPGRVTQRNSRYFELKAIFDRVLAAILLVVLSPVLLACIVAIRVNSPGKAIFLQRRTGAGGRTFTMYKLRSMYRDAEMKSGPQWSQPGDSRATTVGRLLRFAHLDEIPQLVNVLRGEMALVGPRPERPSIVKELIPRVDGYEKRHAIKPGITGLAQIYLPPDDSIDSVKAKVAYDLIYVHYANVRMDFKIVVCTVLRMFAVRGGQGPSWSGLSREVNEIRRLHKETAAEHWDEPATARQKTGDFHCW